MGDGCHGLSKYQMEEILTHEGGGKSAKLDGRYDLIPPEAVEVLAKVMGEGAIKYSINNWRKVPRHIHIGHAINHLFKYMKGEKSEDHLGHALTRVAMACSVDNDEFPYMECRDGQ